MKKSTIVSIVLPTACLFLLAVQRNSINDYGLNFVRVSTSVESKTGAVKDANYGDLVGGVRLNAPEQAQAREFCRFSLGLRKQALDLIQIEPNAFPKPSILCYVHTISPHQEKSEVIRDTWGPRCDKLLFISNETLYDTVHIPLVAYDHAHLWDKSRKSFQYLLKHYPDYDWYYKADDDTYLILENLRAFLARQSLDEPLLFGHRFMFPENVAMRAAPDLYLDFKSKYGPWIYTSGGSGYVINNILLKNMVDHMNQSHCFPNRLTIAEDAAASFCARYAGGYVPETRDRMHRNRFHPLDPEQTVRQEKIFKPDSWWYLWHEGTGGVQGGALSISNDSVAFHYNTPSAMYYIDSQLYACQNYENRTVPVWFRDLVQDDEWMKIYDPSNYRKKREAIIAAALTGAKAHRESLEEKGEAFTAAALTDAKAYKESMEERRKKEALEAAALSDGKAYGESLEKKKEAMKPVYGERLNDRHAVKPNTTASLPRGQTTKTLDNKPQEKVAAHQAKSGPNNKAHLRR